jgi:aspartyl-tRNA(Asn)/glutamyl-tRNA(Gln) amidotransferase subunit B
MNTPEQAAAFMKNLRQLLRYGGVCDGNMEQGSLRCDANVSLKPKGQVELGTRTETKNLNSFRFMQQAIHYEIQRQRAVLESGGSIEQETRLWDTAKRQTQSMRSKEDAHDYRYFPEPDLPVLAISSEFVDAAKGEIPELPRTRVERYTSQWGLSIDAATTITDSLEVAEFFEATVSYHGNAKLVGNWVVNELLRELKDTSLKQTPMTPHVLGELLELVDTGTISASAGKELLPELVTRGGSPKDLVRERGLEQMSDSSALEAIVDRVIADHPGPVENYAAGNSKIIGFFVGQIMKLSQGKANPKLVNELLKKKLPKQS